MSAAVSSVKSARFFTCDSESSSIVPALPKSAVIETSLTPCGSKACPSSITIASFVLKE